MNTRHVFCTIAAAVSLAQLTAANAGATDEIGPNYCATGAFGFPEPSALTLHEAAGDTLPPADTLPEPTVVDVLFLYTEEALKAEGSDEGIRTRVLDSLRETNYRLTNSLVNVVIHPVHIGLIRYTETGDLPLDLERLVNRGHLVVRQAVAPSVSRKVLGHSQHPPLAPLVHALDVGPAHLAHPVRVAAKGARADVALVAGTGVVQHVEGRPRSRLIPSAASSRPAISPTASAWRVSHVAPIAIGLGKGVIPFVIRV